MTIFILHASAGQSYNELGLPFSFVWSIKEGIVIGAILGVAVSILSWQLMKSTTEKKHSRLLAALLNGSLPCIFFLLTYPFTPGWTDYVFAGEVVILGLIVSVSTYWQYDSGHTETYRSVSALKLKHERVLQNLRDLTWAFVFVTASIVFVYFSGYGGQVPENLRYTSSYQNTMAIHAIGTIYLLGGFVINILCVYHQFAKEIEEEVERMDQQK
jgi:hypothetical protein